MSTPETNGRRAVETAGSHPMDMKLEVVVIQVSDVDRAKRPGGLRDRGSYLLVVGHVRLVDGEFLRDGGRNLPVEDGHPGAPGGQETGGRQPHVGTAPRPCKKVRMVRTF